MCRKKKREGVKSRDSQSLGCGFKSPVASVGGTPMLLMVVAFALPATLLLLSDSTHPSQDYYHDKLFTGVQIPMALAIMDLVPPIGQHLERIPPL